MYATEQNIELSLYRKPAFIIGTAKTVQLNKKARVPAYQIFLDFGEMLGKEHKDKYKSDLYKSSAQLTENHELSDLTSRQVLCIANFPRKQIGTSMSDCLVTGVQDPELEHAEKRKSTVAVCPSSPVANGSLVNLDGEEKILETNNRDLEWKTFQKVDIRVGKVKGGKVVKVSKSIELVMLNIDFGLEKDLATVVKWSEMPEDIIGKQVLGAVNIQTEDLKKDFEVEAEALLFSPKEGVWLTPFNAVSNGYKLA